MAETGRLTSLSAGQLIPFGGDRYATVSDDLASAFEAGDRLVVVQETGDLLRIPRTVVELVDQRVTAASSAFPELSTLSGAAFDHFYESFARQLENEVVFERIAAANREDVDRARSAGRSTTRLEISSRMRADMIAALRMWRDLPDGRDLVTERVEHDGWVVEARRAPSGVVGFVFEGRPNVFADATGVLRTGNTVVFRIGSDALATARAMMDSALIPALRDAGLPVGAVQLVDSAERSAGHALFDDRRLALAVARGSGPAVAQLGAVARQAGVPVSLHGTGGAWLIIDTDVDLERVSAVTEASLDRKVCNTANVLCIPDRVDILESVLNGVAKAAERRGTHAVVHLVGQRTQLLRIRLMRDEAVTIHFREEDDAGVLTVEWEWEDAPEVSIMVVDSTNDAVDLFNRHSPLFIVSVLSNDPDAVDAVYRGASAPFVGDGFTRWVDGQFALGRPELGLSNWQNGRLLARGGILSGDSVFTVRYVSHHDDPNQRR